MPDNQNTPAEAKPRVFISYSRDDLDFADQLDVALRFISFEPLIDRHGISAGEAWRQRLAGLIISADTVVFVLSPTSVKSEICAWEVQEAKRLSKRVIPIVCRPLEDAAPPADLSELNYIFFYREPSSPDSGFGHGLVQLATALSTNIDWLREQTRYLERATEWASVGRPTNRLLSGSDIAIAKDWITRRPQNASPPTELHLDFVRASEDWDQHQRNVEAQRINEVAEAQEQRTKALAEREAALNAAAASQKRRVRFRKFAITILSLVTAAAVWQWWRAEQQRDVALDNLEALKVGLVTLAAQNAATHYKVSSPAELVTLGLPTNYRDEEANSSEAVISAANSIEIIIRNPSSFVEVVRNNNISLSSHLALSHAYANLAAGDISMSAGKLPDAKFLYLSISKLIALDPETVTGAELLYHLHARLALCMVQEGKFDEAADHYRRGLDLANRISVGPDSTQKEAARSVDWFKDRLRGLDDLRKRG